jgi:hypothetical protein
LSNSEPLYSITISTDPEAEVVIFDGYDCVKERGTGTANWNLPPGLYTVRAQLGGLQLQKTISVPETTSLNLTPEIYSSAPIDGAATTHEYYHDPAQTWSVQQTAVLPSLGVGGWLFVFVRLSSFNSPRNGDLANGLTLRDANGALILDFAAPGLSQKDDQFGWTLVSTPIAPGFYRLRHEGEETRETSLYVYPGFSTQVFITYFHRPRLEQMRAFLRPLGQPFQAGDIETRAVDLALLGLQNGISSISQTLPRADQRNLLDGKFLNPMLGLIGAHWLLEDPSAQPAFVDMVLTNLRMLLGPAPDVIALEIAAAKRFKKPTLPVEPVLTPPFLRRGLEILAQEQPQLIPDGGLLESILAEMYLDSPWTSWRAPSVSAIGEFRAFAPSDAVVDKSLDWMESAILAAGLRGELDYNRVDAIAKQLVITPALLRSANTRLLKNLESKSPTLRFNEAYLVKGQKPEIELDFESWSVKGAAVYNQPLPTGFAHSTAFLRAQKDLVLLGALGYVSLDISEGETSVVFGNWTATLQEVDDSRSGLSALLPKSWIRGSAPFVLSASYRSKTPRGAIALGSTGPKSEPRARQLKLLSVGKSWCGLRDSIELLLRDFGLPREVAKSSPHEQQSLLFAHVEGSFRFNFSAEVAFECLRPAEDQEEWYSAKISYPLMAAGTLTASGAFQVGLFRESNGTLKFRIQRAADSEDSPIHLADFQIGPKRWIDWLQKAAAEADKGPIATTLRSMAGAFATRVRERAFYRWLNSREGQEESWYRAERTEIEDVGGAIARVLSRQYIAALRDLLERRTDAPLLEIETQHAEDLREALDGLFDLRAERAGTSLSGTLVSLARAPQPCTLLLSFGKPASLSDDGDRVAAVDLSHSLATVLAQIQAAAAQKSAPTALSAPSAVFTSFFLGATSPVLRTLLFGLVQRWFPGEQKGWPSLISRVGEQAGLLQWNAILQLKLRWAIDIRKGGGDLAPEPDLIHPALRRELRLLLPFLAFRELENLANLKLAIPLLVYHSLPTDVSSAVDLEMNPAVNKSLLDLLLALRPAMLSVGVKTADEQWNVPTWLEVASSSWRLKQLLAWEEHLNLVASRALSQISRNPHFRLANLDRLAIDIVDALSDLPLLTDRPHAVNALRSLLFTTTISLMASSPANVATELSITAVAPETLPLPSWVDSPDSVPLDKIAAYGRLTAMAESATPSARKAKYAVA